MRKKPAGLPKSCDKLAWEAKQNISQSNWIYFTYPSWARRKQCKREAQSKCDCHIQSRQISYFTANVASLWFKIYFSLWKLFFVHLLTWKYHPVLTEVLLQQHPCESLQQQPLPTSLQPVCLRLHHLHQSFNGNLRQPYPAFVAGKRMLVGSSILRSAENYSDWTFSRWMGEISALKPESSSCIAREAINIMA